MEVSLFGPDNYRSAVISHYLRSKKRNLRKHAIEYASDLLKGYLNGELNSQVAEDALQTIIKFNDDVLFPTPVNPKFTFIDLFAGIGGFRFAMQRLQGECVFTSEWDNMAQRTYYANFGEIPFGDITKEETKKWIPKNLIYSVQDFRVSHFLSQVFQRKIVLEENMDLMMKNRAIYFFILLK